jgi:hypothetical protein
MPGGADHLGKSPFGKGSRQSKADLAASPLLRQKIGEGQI